MRGRVGTHTRPQLRRDHDNRAVTVAAAAECRPVKVAAAVHDQAAEPRSASVVTVAAAKAMLRRLDDR